MSSHLIKTALLTWCILLVIAMINGALRNVIYKPYVGDLLAHQISTVIAVAAFTVVIYFMFKSYLTSATNIQLLLVGLLLVLLTEIFEFGAGHYLFGNSWEKLFADYNIFRGRLWILVLFTELITPILFKLLKR